MAALEPGRGGLFVDATVGLGGHSEALLEGNDDVRVLGIDRDADALALAVERLHRFGARFRPVHANFRELADVLERESPNEPLAGLLADLGVSSMQLDEAERGFSFTREAALDMRMDRSRGETAADLVNTMEEGALADLIYEYGEERASRRIARAICRARDRGPISTTTELADLVARASGIPRHKQRIHPATRTFQALRIAVNGELDGLDRFLEDAVTTLVAPGGRIAVITFHSLEDRIVKRTFNALSGQCSCPPGFPVCICGARRRIRLLTRKPVIASDREIDVNPRARSAKLRSAERLEAP